MPVARLYLWLCVKCPCVRVCSSQQPSCIFFVAHLFIQRTALPHNVRSASVVTPCLAKMARVGFKQSRPGLQQDRPSLQCSYNMQVMTNRPTTTSLRRICNLGNQY
eukprot:Gb_29895 [translate_table: standard]